MNYPLLSEKMKGGTVGFPKDVLAVWSEVLQKVGVVYKRNEKIELKIYLILL